MRLVSVIVPAYNEVCTICGTVSEIVRYFEHRPYDCEVIVAADGDDGTREMVAAMANADPRIRAIGHKARRGKGRGIREAVHQAKGDVIGFVDADNKTPITEFDKFERPLEEGFDLVIGSRALGESVIERAQPRYRQLGSRVFAFAMHAVVGLHGISDTQCGFKFFAREAALDLFGRQRIDGYMFDVEILDLAVRTGYRIAQVPVRWRDDGDSRMRLVRTNLNNSMDILRIRFNRRSADRGHVRGIQGPGR